MEENRDPSMRQSLIRTMICLGLGLLASPLAAQFSQYTSASDFEDDFVSTEQLIEAAMAEARWRRGPLLIDPWIGLREATYDDNVGNRPREPILSDYLVKVGAGLRFYAPVADDLVVAAHLLPEYVWWQELSSRRQLDGRYGVGLFGPAGPFHLAFSAQHIDDTKFFSREFEDRVDTSEDYLRFEAELDLGHAVSLFAAGALDSYGFDPLDEEETPPVDDLDRDETIARFGVRWRPREGLRLGLGIGVSQVDFERDPRRTNKGTAALLELDLAGNRVSANARLAWRSLEADGAASLFPDFDDLSGRYRVAFQVAGPVQLELLGYRNLVYSFQDSFAYFIDQATSVGVAISLGSRAGLQLRWEDGENDYAVFDPSRAPRLDRFDGPVGELQLELGRFTLVVSGSRTEYDSNVPQFDREVTTVSAGLIFGRRVASPWG